jgi:hypothetical protein
MAVYFIRAGEDGPIKIGFADDAATRLRELQTGNHLDLRIVATREGGRTQEALLHDYLDEDCIRGEWFRPTERVLAVVGGAEVPSPPEQQARAPHLLDHLGGNSFICRTLGLKPSAVSMWRKHGVPHKYRIAIKQLAQRAGIAVPEGFVITAPEEAA